MRLNTKRLLALLLLLLTGYLFARSEIRLVTQVIQVNNHAITVEIADTDATRATGLMYRTQMDAMQGMLFVFPSSQHRSFYMKNTLIPLSIAYINAQGVIMEIHDMQPLNLQSVYSQYPAMYALELNQGMFAKLGITPGMKILQLPPASKS
jgi:uncharacterized protein